MTQSEALLILKTGANVFLTGEPGSGKTHTINQYVRYIRECGIEVAITASTGIAATHIGGMTIHSWSGIGIRNTLSSYELDKIATTEYVVKRVGKAKILIIDEISMLSPGTLSMVDSVCREVKQKAEPFGGMQVIFVGDFFQLPPIIKRDETPDYLFDDLEKKSLFAYDSPAWIRAQPLVCYLSEQHRQEDTDLLSLLSALRQNEITDSHIEFLEKRKVDPLSIPSGVPKLYTHNVDVDRVNDDTLSKISAEEKYFTMESRGPDALVGILKKGCLSPEKLCLKVGAEVMCTKNNPQVGFVNGTLGTVVGFEELKGSPIIKIRSGREITIEPMEWAMEENGKIKARIIQYPLRLAWAITVHKSQGISLDEAVMDLRSVFEFGQGYVALSRVRRFSGLYLLGWNARAFEVHPDVLEKDAEFRLNSDQAEEVFQNIPKEELKEMHQRYIVALGGKKSSKKKNGKKDKGENSSKSNYFEEMRTKHPNAYLRWSEQDDEKLRGLFENGSTIQSLAKEFGRKTGAITARLIKLELIEPEE